MTAEVLMVTFPNPITAGASGNCGWEHAARDSAWADSSGRAHLGSGRKAECIDVCPGRVTTCSAQGPRNVPAVRASDGGTVGTAFCSSPHYSPPCLSHPAARAFDAISRARLLDRPPKSRLPGPPRNLAPNSRGDGGTPSCVGESCGLTLTLSGRATAATLLGSGAG
jgi:hypothetical protein